MDVLRLTDYFIYIGASAFLTVWVSRTLFRNGRAWLMSVFKEEGLADSVNRLLVVGFYLINFGAVALLMVQPFELFFLFLQFLDDGLHGCGHECRGIVGARCGVQIFRFAFGRVLKDFA